MGFTHLKNESKFSNLADALRWAARVVGFCAKHMNRLGFSFSPPAKTNQMCECRSPTGEREKKLRLVARVLATTTTVLAIFVAAAFAQIPLSQRRSGYDLMSRDTKAMQDDDTSNPATLSVLDGEAMWAAKAGTAGKSCADCHGDAEQSMRGVSARYPAFNATKARPIDIEQRINLCRTEKQNATPLPFESRELLAITAYVGKQSRGEPIAVADDEKTRSFIEAGRKIYARRQGQLNLSCQNCHDDNAGQKLAGVELPQGHPTGYPLYRLEWQSIGSLQRRLRNCMIGMRAEPYAYGSDENVDLELFLMSRARGMKVETPAVRP
jgi:sulfur-oxidizing protein SoxA